MTSPTSYIFLIGNRQPRHRSFEQLLAIAYGERVELLWTTVADALSAAILEPEAIILFTNHDISLSNDKVTLLQDTFAKTTLIRVDEDAPEEMSVQFMNPEVFDRRSGDRLHRHSLGSALRIALQIANRRKRFLNEQLT